MRRMRMLALALAVVAAPAEAGRAVKIVEPVPAAIVGHSSVVATEVTIGATAKPIVDKLEAKAAEKRAEAKLPPVDTAAAPAARPPSEHYATLPLTMMMPLAIEDVTRDWGLTGGRPVKLLITIDTLKTADAGMALLLGSADELAGLVNVVDAADGTKLGSFYVDVINFRSGMFGLAIRGSGVREKLADEFAKHIAKQLGGTTHKPAKAKT